MKVRAIKRGFLGGVYRRPNDVFDCPSNLFSSTWMIEVKKGDEPLVIEPNAYIPLEIPSLMNKTDKARPKSKQGKK